VPAIVIAGSSWRVPTALGVVRSLGRAGVPIICVTEDANMPVAKSKYVKAIELCEGDSEQALVEALLHVGERYGPGTPVFPTSDRHCLVLAKYAEQLKSTVSWSWVPLDVMTYFTDKTAAYELARELSIRIPATAIIRHTEDMEEAIKQIPTPWLLKPPGHWVVSGEEIAQPDACHHLVTKAVVVNSEVVLRETVQKVCRAGESLVLQEYVPGSDECHYEVDLYMGERASQVFVGRKLRQYPPQIGTGCYSSSVPNWREDEKLKAVVHSSVSFAKALSFKGLCHFDWKRHEESGEYYFIEPNPRVSQWGILAAASGVNLPLLSYVELVYGPEAAEQHSAPRKNAKRPVYFWDELSDPRAYKQLSSKNRLWILRYLFAVKGPRERAFLTWDDPLPGITAIFRDIKETVVRKLRQREKKGQQ